MDTFDIPNIFKVRTEHQKNRFSLVRSFIDFHLVKDSSNRVEFKKLNQAINAYIAKQKCETVSRIELSRCLKILKVDIEYYRGAHLPGYDWKEKASRRQVAHRIDPTDYIEDWKRDRLTSYPGFAVNIVRTYNSFCDWCSSNNKPVCTIRMFSICFRKVLDPENGEPPTYRKYNLTYFEDWVCLEDFEHFMKHKAGKHMKVTPEFWFESQDRHAHYYYKEKRDDS